MAERRLVQAHGNWVAGPDRFWDREKEIALFVQALDEGACIHLVSQRRSGKTSLMREVARRLEKRYLCLHVDLQKTHSPEDLTVELGAATFPHHSLWEKTREIFSNCLERTAARIESLDIHEIRLKLREGLVRGNWQAKGNRLLAALASEERPVVVFMDEAPILVNRILKGADYEMTAERIVRADELMSWLRDNCHRHRDKIRFVVTGSIGFEPILRQARLSAALNHFKPFHLDPWDAATAIGCLEALARNYGVRFKDGASARVVERLGSCIPHHVQMFFAHIYENCRKRDDMFCCAEDVDAVYEARMLSTRGHAELSTFEERLKLMVGAQMLPFVLDLLTETAVVVGLSPDALAFYRTDHGLNDRSGKEKTREALEILEHDGYLRQAQSGYTFISHLLRDWWARRFGFEFVEFSKRGKQV